MQELFKSKVLIVDDLQTNQTGIKTILEQALDHVEIISVGSGSEALEQLMQNQFVVVLFDIRIPNLSSYEVAQMATSQQVIRQSPIVIITTQEALEEDVNKAYEWGVVDYLVRPLNPLVLKNKVQQFVELYQAQKIAEQLKAEQEIILNTIGSGIIKVSANGIIEYGNTEAARLFQLMPQALIGMNVNTRFKSSSSEDVQGSWFDDLFAMIVQRGIHQRCDIAAISSENNTFPVELTGTLVPGRNREAFVVMLFEDITERVEAEKRLLHLAHYDPLTDLANTAYFHDSLARAIARSKRQDSIVAVMMLDLDYFKKVNDAHGHSMGDAVLVTIADRIKKSIHAYDIAGRMGGDEFAVIAEELESEEHAINIAQHLLHQVAKPFELREMSFQVSTSIGLTYCYRGMKDEATLLKEADIALYHAKANGRNSMQLFTSNMSVSLAYNSPYQSHQRPESNLNCIKPKS